MKSWKVFAGCGLGLWLAVAIGCASVASSNEAGGEKRAAEGRIEKGDAAAGQAVFDTNCGACHRAGRHDTEGHAPDLMGRKITMRQLSRHHGQSLSATDAADLNAFLAGQ